MRVNNGESKPASVVPIAQGILIGEHCPTNQLIGSNKDGHQKISCPTNSLVDDLQKENYRDSGFAAV